MVITSFRAETELLVFLLYTVIHSYTQLWVLNATLHVKFISMKLSFLRHTDLKSSVFHLLASSTIHALQSFFFGLFTSISCVSFLFPCDLNLFVRTISPSFSSLYTSTRWAQQACSLFLLVMCFFIYDRLCVSFSWYWSCKASSGETLWCIDQRTGYRHLLVYILLHLQWCVHWMQVLLL